MQLAEKRNTTQTLARALFVAALLPLFSAAACAQQASPPTAAPNVAPTSTPDIIMSRQQSKDLLDSVDSIMTFAAKDTGLAMVPHLKRRLISRQEVTRYLIKNFDEDDSAKRLQRSEIVLKKFGLLNRDFHLRPFLLSLLTEQIAGFYDPKTKTVNLLNWIPLDEQKPVLAHELTHALQDQKVNLERWSSNSFHGMPKTASEDNQHVHADELETARQAVTEGQAMVVFIDYSLKDTGKTLADVPDLGVKLRESAGDTGSSPIMARAPLLLQRSLLFPYADGLGFEQALLVRGGTKAAFEQVLATPPSSSFEIMHPEAFLAHGVVPVLTLPDVHPLLDSDYEPYDTGVMGELDVEMMASLFGGQQVAAALSPAWAGGVYYAAQRKASTATERESTGSLAVFYLSRWKSAEAARAFGKLYAGQLARKYNKLVERKSDDAAEQVFSSEEGDILLTNIGADFFIAEGFPLATARRLRDAAEAVQGVGPMKLAATPTHELTLSTVHVIAHGLTSASLMRAGLAQARRYTSPQR